MDNHSTDESVTIALGYVDARIKVHRTPRHMPLGAARNEALSQVKGEWVAFLDTDDVWHPEKLRRQAEYLQEHPEVEFLYTNYASFVADEDWRLARPRLREPQPVGWVFGNFLDAYPVNLQTVLLKRAGLGELSELFSADFEVAEEFDLFLRFLYRRQAGYLPELLVYYRLHTQQMSRTKLVRYAVEMDLAVKKLKTIYPETVVRYPANYARLEEKVIYYRARAKFQAGDKRAARVLLLPLLARDWRYLVLYLLLIVPGDLFGVVHKITGRYY